MKQALITHTEQTPALLALFDFYGHAVLNSNSPYESYLDQARRFLTAYKEEFYEELANLNPFIGRTFFEFDGEWKPREKFDMIIGFENFCKTVSNEFNEHKAEFIDMKGVTRAVLPEIRSFDYIGHNELDVSFKPSNYALLYR